MRIDFNELLHGASPCHPLRLGQAISHVTLLESLYRIHHINLGHLLIRIQVDENKAPVKFALNIPGQDYIPTVHRVR